MPKKVVVLGGGVIGVEFSSVWKSWGADVQIVEALPHLVPNEDESVSKQFERAFRKRGINFSLGVRFQSVTQDDNGVVVTLEDGQTFDGELLLVAVGRGPRTANLGYEEVGVTMDRGFVITNERLATSVPGVYAVGDIVPGPAARTPRLPAGHLRRRGDRRAEPDRRRGRQHSEGHLQRPRGGLDRSLRGQSGREVRRGQDHRRTTTTWPATARATFIGTAGSVKVVRVNDGPVVGVHMIGARVGELIGEAQLAVNWEAYPEDIAPLIHAHPTQNEALGEAFLALAGKPLHAI